MLFHSTRNDQEKVSGARAILDGLAPDGGLYVPETFPRVDLPMWMTLSYTELTAELLSLFFTDFSYEDLLAMAEKAYEKFEEDPPVELTLTQNGSRAFLELWHGPTLAFKDMALSLLPYLMGAAQEKEGDHRQRLVLTATSGDTGKAAMAGFAGLPGMGVIVFYPYQGVAAVQRDMMLGEREANVLALAVRGNFDDCQRGVKTLFADPELGEQLAREGLALTSANSINIGRLIPQIVYYIWAYLELVRQGQLSYGAPLNVVVPTGNFGDVLAAFYAQKMRLPLGTIGVASNANRILYDFAKTGVYDRRRKLVKTSSPSMDILLSSNLERYLYLKEADPAYIRRLMEDLKEEGTFSFNKKKLYPAVWADEEEVAWAIRLNFDFWHYLIDPHTAVAYQGAETLFPKQSCLVVSTASPYKFPTKLLRSLGQTVPEEAREAMEALSAASGTAIPQTLQTLYTNPLRPEIVISPDQMASWVLKKGGSLHEES